MFKEGKVSLLLGKGIEGVSDTVMEVVGEGVKYWIRSGGREERICCMVI